MNYEQMTAPCGLDCFNCIVYLANENQEMRTAVSEHLDIPLEEAVCKGCRNENGKCSAIPKGMECNVYPCAEKKGIKFCCDCTDFPCDYLHPYADQAAHVPHNTKVFNLCLIKKLGLETWGKNKAKSVKAVYFKGNWKL
ncbi:MAG: DUF3795 domain-containing protein [Deltaproteobacteria bacterium]|nr:DUF3795 domain-containing protein [Deltaproteobacteria bacterium]MBW1847359.1 DUF3795 domain-containing protein [Deltaproteobacteria bacterium]MBW2180710.1 DUF3795 domain-containing protein [Deltaproteobacteria bacterium]MBW2365361.1 DUF3795 domain-containing protein [Deltaproteobacteria bacterium]